MAGEDAAVGALACRAPEEDVFVHAAGGYVGTGGIEARAEDFARMACLQLERLLSAIND